MENEEYEQAMRDSASRASAYGAARTGYEMQYNELGLLNQELGEYYYIELDVHRLSVVDANVQTAGCWEGNTKDAYESNVIDDISAVVFAAYNDTIISMQEDIALKMEELSGKIEECGDKIREELRYQIDSIIDHAKSGGK